MDFSNYLTTHRLLLWKRTTLSIYGRLCLISICLVGLYLIYTTLTNIPTKRVDNLLPIHFKDKLDKLSSQYNFYSIHQSDLDTNDCPTFQSIKTKEIKEEQNNTSNQTFTSGYFSMRDYFPFDNLTVELNTTHCNTRLPYFVGNWNTNKRIYPALDKVLRINENLEALENQSVTQWSDYLPQVCESSHTFLLTILFSEYQDTEIRKQIRETWSSFMYYKDETSNTDSPKFVDHLFLVPLTQNLYSNASVFVEAQLEQDLLLMTMKSSQLNQANLHLLASEFVLRKCTNKLNYILFISTDIIPNFSLLVNFLASQNRPTPTMYCLPRFKENYARMNSKQITKWGEEQKSPWNSVSYPTYCDLDMGGFVMDLNSLLLWLSCAQLYKQFNPQQIYLTGLVRKAAAIASVPYWQTYGNSVRMMPSMSCKNKAGNHLFFLEANKQPFWVWQSVVRAINENGFG